MNTLRHVAVAVLSLALSGPGFAAARPADTFDEPRNKKVVDLGPSPNYPAGNIHTQLSCYAYPAFVVKQYDEGQKGAEWLAIAPIKKAAVPQCDKSYARGEWIIEKTKSDWAGYFRPEGVLPVGVSWRC